MNLRLQAEAGEKSSRAAGHPAARPLVTFRRPVAYRQYVIAAVMLAAAVLLAIVAGLAWTARVVQVGNLDALALADKVATPYPVSALDWPELQVKAIVPQPDDRPLLLLLMVGRPHHRRQEATLLLALDSGDQRSLALLSQWCASGASVAPTRQRGAALELRRRRSLERVHALLLAEDRIPARTGRS
jgi:hypothetical protein